jgi:ABC-type lipoprotein release transport system permease subunit
MKTGIVKVVTVLAWRNLWRNYRRTGIMLAAITIGIWAMIFMTALMRGMVDDMLVNGIRQLPGEIKIQHINYRDDPSINNSIESTDSADWQPLVDAIRTHGGIDWTSRIRVPAVISSEYETRGITLVGIDPASEADIGFDPDTIIEGRYLEDVDDKGVIIGQKLAERLDTRLGKRVVIMSQDPDNNIADSGFRVVGIYKAKLAGQEEQFIYSGRRTLQTMLHIQNSVSEIVLSAGDYRHVDQWLPEIESAVAEIPGHEQLSVTPWYVSDSYLGSMLSMMDGFVLVWIIVIFLALSFGLMNTLVMAVFERVREIGLMQALGMAPSMILYQVLLECLFLVLIGLFIGNLMAYGTIQPLKDGIDVSVVAKGMEMMGTSTMLYPSLQLKDIVVANIIVIILSLVTSLLPAWRAAHYDPVDALNKT